MELNKIKCINEQEKCSVKRATDGSLIFKHPEELKEMLDKQLGFDYNNLMIQAEPSVLQLMEHLSKQAGWECFLHTQCAYIKNQIEVFKEEYNSWYNTTAHKHRSILIDEHKSKFSESMLTNLMYKKYNYRILKSKSTIIQLETKYRDMCGIRDAMINKGKYLQTLKGLIDTN